MAVGGLVRILSRLGPPFSVCGSLAIDLHIAVATADSCRVSACSVQAERNLTHDQMKLRTGGGRVNTGGGCEPYLALACRTRPAVVSVSCSHSFPCRGTCCAASGDRRERLHWSAVGSTSSRRLNAWLRRCCVGRLRLVFGVALIARFDSGGVRRVELPKSFAGALRALATPCYSFAYLHLLSFAFLTFFTRDRIHTSRSALSALLAISVLCRFCRQPVRQGLFDLAANVRIETSPNEPTAECLGHVFAHRRQPAFAD